MSLDSLPEIIWLKDQYPILKDCEIQVSQNPNLEGGRFNLPSPEQGMSRVRVEIAQGDDASFELLKRERKSAVEKMAEHLGRPVEGLNGTTIRKFIILHEFGHAYDFLMNFAANPQNALPNILDRWHTATNEELMTLPFPGISPSEIREWVAEMGSFDTWRTHDQRIAEWCVENNISSLDDLLELQENAYRQLPKETFADSFASEAVRLFESSHASSPSKTH